MNVLVSDYREQMEKDYELTKDAIVKALAHSLGPERAKELKMVVEPYGTEKFYRELAQAQGLITAFLPVDRNFLAQAPCLKYISINAVGYSNLEQEAVKEAGIQVCHIKEYCTREVSEHALAMLMALNNNLKLYDRDVAAGNWNYGSAPMRPSLDNMTAVIFGFGKIGRCTGKLLSSLGMKVAFVDPYVSVAQGRQANAQKLELEAVFQEADVIINHMALTQDNYHMFDYDFFVRCTRKPIFINVGRGGCVEEEGLVRALKEELIYGAGLDVLEDENPKLTDSPLTDCENVILTPHAAFYSANSMARLHQISGANMGYMLAGAEDKTKELI